MGWEYSSSIYSGAFGVWEGSTAVLYIVEYSSSIYSGASGVWEGSTAVLYIVEHLECGMGVQQFYI